MIQHMEIMGDLQPLETVSPLTRCLYFLYWIIVSAEFLHVTYESVHCLNRLISVILTGNHLYSVEVPTLKGLCIVQ